MKQLSVLHFKYIWEDHNNVIGIQYPEVRLLFGGRKPFPYSLLAVVVITF